MHLNWYSTYLIEAINVKPQLLLSNKLKIEEIKTVGCGSHTVRIDVSLDCYFAGKVHFTYCKEPKYLQYSVSANISEQMTSVKVFKRRRSSRYHMTSQLPPFSAHSAKYQDKTLLGENMAVET